MPLVNRNKRHGPDIAIKVKKVFILLAWIFMFAFFMALSIAKPRVPTMFDRLYDGDTLPGLWSSEFLTIAIYFMIPVATASAVGLILNARRHNRKYDKYSKSLIIFFILSLSSIILFFVL